MLSARNSTPFTTTQWKELEHQALIFKYMVSGMPIPPDLLFPLKRSLDCSISLRLFPHQPMGWDCFPTDFGRKVDPEPGRCRRTDGKKWRCSKEAFPDSKYCERHMHRGRNRSRKPVEVITTNSSSTTTSSSYSLSSSITAETHHHHHCHPYNKTTLHSSIYPHSSSKSPGIGFSPQNSTTHLVLDSESYSQSDKDYRNRYAHGLKEEVDERNFFPEASGTLRNVLKSSVDDPCRFTSLTMSSSPPTQPRERNYSVLNNGYSQLQLQSLTDLSKQQQEQHCFVLDTDFNSERPVKLKKEEQQQPLLHFFDEWPLKSRDSWLDLEEDPSNWASFLTTQLSISIPMSSTNFPVSNAQTHKDS